VKLFHGWIVLRTIPRMARRKRLRRPRDPNELRIALFAGVVFGLLFIAALILIMIH
jgi:hypothetical protein